MFNSTQIYEEFFHLNHYNLLILAEFSNIHSIPDGGHIPLGGGVIHLEGLLSRVLWISSGIMGGRGISPGDLSTWKGLWGGFCG